MIKLVDYYVDFSITLLLVSDENYQQEFWVALDVYGHKAIGGSSNEALFNLQLDIYETYMKKYGS